MLKSLIINNAVSLIIHVLSAFTFIATYNNFFSKPSGEEEILAPLILTGVIFMLWFFIAFFFTGIIFKKSDSFIIDMLSVSFIAVFGIFYWLVSLHSPSFMNWLGFDILFFYTEFINVLFRMEHWKQLRLIYAILPTLIFFSGMQFRGIRNSRKKHDSSR